MKNLLVFSLLIGFILTFLSYTAAQNQRQVGLLTEKEGVAPGYILFAPKHNTMTYLMDVSGQVVHRWDASGYEPGQSVYLQENGYLLRMCFAKNQVFGGGGDGGRFEEYDWNDNLVWEMDMSYGNKNTPDDAFMCHHDCAILPNGNILAIVWEYKNKEVSLQAGRDPNKMKEEYLWPDYVAEIEKTGSHGGNIVWEWHVWDHLVQDYNASKNNYGVVGEHPELIDVNFWAETGRPYHANWNHMNSIEYNAELDVIMLSVRGFSEVWVIDHSTSTEEAAGHSGGNFGRGGDLLYRWGNPRAYRAGSNSDQILFQGHDCQWIESGIPGAGNILMYNNGPELGYSTIVEWDFPEPVNHLFTLNDQGRYDPQAPAWVYHPSANYQAWKFFSGEISGCQRLPNGNTLICSGTNGFFSEVTADQSVVWEYINPMEKEDALFWNEEPGLDNRNHGLNAVFKIHKYPPDYPAFAGKELLPQGLIEQGMATGSAEINAPDLVFQVSPNPLADQLMISSHIQSTAMITVFNTDGKVVYTKESNKQQESIDVAGWPAGTYFVQLRAGTLTGIQKVVKN